MKEHKTFVFLCDVNNVLLMIASQLYRDGINVKYIPDLKLNQHFRIWDAPIDFEFGPERFSDLSVSENLGKNLILARSPQYVKDLLLTLIGNNSIVIGSDYAPAIFAYANLKLDYFVATGADVNSYTIKPKRSNLAIAKEFAVNLRNGAGVKQSLNRAINKPDLAILQRLGISQSNILINSAFFNWEPLKNVKFTMVPYPLPGAVKSFGVANTNQSAFPLNFFFDELKANSDLLIVNISKNDFWKGTHIFFEGFQKYKLKTSLKVKLLIFGRGNLEMVKKKFSYVEELICAGDIIILPPVSQREVEGILSYADICLGAISDTGYLFDWNTSLMQYSKMCKPLITHCPFEKFSGFEDIPVYPHLNANNAEEISNCLIKLENLSLREKYSSEMNQWIKEFTKISQKKWLEVLSSTGV